MWLSFHTLGSVVLERGPTTTHDSLKGYTRHLSVEIELMVAGPWFNVFVVESSNTNLKSSTNGDIAHSNNIYIKFLM